MSGSLRAARYLDAMGLMIIGLVFKYGVGQVLGINWLSPRARLPLLFYRGPIFRRLWAVTKINARGKKSW